MTQTSRLRSKGGAWALIPFAAGCSLFSPRVGEEIGESDAGIEASSVDASPLADALDTSTTLEAVSFKRDIRPRMEREPRDPTGGGCKGCHYSTASVHPGLDESGLDLATLGALRRGGNTTGVSIVIPSDPDGSALVQKLEGTYSHGSRMPKGLPRWSQDDIALVRRWIQEGAGGGDDE